MIKIAREGCPNVLNRNPRLKSYYNHVDVTLALNRMQFEKCAYCEKLIRDGAQIDHYNPLEAYVTGKNATGKKIYDWHQANIWENLLYTCTKCNGAKKKHLPLKGSRRQLINPTLSDPERFIDFNFIGLGTPFLEVTIISKNSSKIGKSSIEILKLDMRKKDHLGPLAIFANELDKLFIEILMKLLQGTQINHVDCQSVISRFHEYMLSNRPYAGFSRAFMKKRLEHFERFEKSGIEARVGYQINLGITVPTGIKTN
jgi:hypothetical protein